MKLNVLKNPLLFRGMEVAMQGQGGITLFYKM